MGFSIELPYQQNAKLPSPPSGASSSDFRFLGFDASVVFAETEQLSPFALRNTSKDES